MGGRGRKHDKRIRHELITLIQEAHFNGARLGKACQVVGISVRTYQRWKNPLSHADARKGAAKHVPKKLPSWINKRVIEVVNQPRFSSLPPSQIIPILADEEDYICSERSFYRILHANLMQHHRGATKAPQPRSCPRLTATRIHQVFSWDITYLPATTKGTYYYLYLFMDIFSRFIVGWHIDERQDNSVAAKTLVRICKKENIQENELTLHSDNGGPMKGSTMLATMVNLGVVKSFSRPATSNDNPFSEALFKTVKYCPKYPKKPFQSLQAASAWMETFVRWYNDHHRHSGISFVTPSQRHTGQDVAILKARDELYKRAKSNNKLRWSGKTRNWERIEAVHINPL